MTYQIKIRVSKEQLTEATRVAPVTEIENVVLARMNIADGVSIAGITQVTPSVNVVFPEGDAHSLIVEVSVVAMSASGSPPALSATARGTYRLRSTFEPNSLEAFAFTNGFLNIWGVLRGYVLATTALTGAPYTLPLVHLEQKPS